MFPFFRAVVFLFLLQTFAYSALSVLKQSPTDNSTNVATNSEFILIFNQAIQSGTSGAVKVYNESNSLVHSFDVNNSNSTALNFSGSQLKIDLPNDLNSTTGYYVKVDAGAVKDTNGSSWVGYSNSTVWNFRATPYPESVIAGGQSHTAYIHDSNLTGAGENYLGQGGFGSDQNSTSQNIASGTWNSIATGANFNLAIKSNGSLWAWGNNAFGQLGLGDTVSRSTPTQIGSATDWASVAAGSRHVVALKTDGTLWAWGNNDFGQLGLSASHAVPTQVGSGSSWRKIASGVEHSLAIDSNRSLYAWGSHGFGQLGISSQAGGSAMTQVAGEWRQVFAGGFSTVAISTDGEAFAWGKNNKGQLGLGHEFDCDAPVKIGVDNDWSYAALGIHHSLLVKSNGDVYAAGSNRFKQLGLSTSIDKTNVFIQTHTNVVKGAQQVGAGAFHSLGLFGNEIDNELYSWGQGKGGKLGGGSVIDSNQTLIENFIAD